MLYKFTSIKLGGGLPCRYIFFSTNNCQLIHFVCYRFVMDGNEVKTACSVIKTRLVMTLGNDLGDSES